MDQIDNTFDKIIPINIEKEMKKSYLDYAMTVIVSRALPDVRDGLKPVHRRILYAMSELGVTPDKPHRKSARIVGDVLGKYHPHGDSAVYDAMVRLAQDFSTRFPLVDGHGNFGSVDGDSAAAMRYTEARMSKIAMEMLRDINKETVDYKFNFDETLKEPVVLPSKYPNLLVNGSNGIAVGMASSIPPHNLGEVIDGTVAYIENSEITIDELIGYIKGPDFPTGAEIIGKDNIKKAYRTGRGKVIVKAIANIEEMKNNKTRIIVTEIPYQVNKSRLIEKIADLVREKKIEGITDLRDESDRTGMRIVIEIKKDYNPNIVLNNLYKHTQMRDTFSIIMIALVNGEPKVLNLKEMIHYYVMHQKDVIKRRTQYDLDKAEARAHILEGLKIALDNIDEIIAIIRSSYNNAEEKLMTRFNLSEIQAKAIVDMRLRRLQGLEREKLEEEYQELMKMIHHFKEILANEFMLMDIIKSELIEIKEKYNNIRRTAIKADEAEINMEDLIEEQEIAITVTNHGYVKRLPEDTYRIQKRGGKGVIGLSTREGDYVKDILITSTHDNLLFFTNRGKIYEIKAYEIPEAKRQAKGTAIINLIPVESGERVTKIIPIREKQFENEELLFCTKLGKIKKTKISEFNNIRKSGIIAIKLEDEDELIGVSNIIGGEDIFITSQKGKAIRFNEEDVRSMGRTAMGVKAITLNRNDEIVSISILNEDKIIFIITENGFGKMTKTSLYRSQARAGKGVKTYKITKKTGDIVGAEIIEKEDEIMLISKDGVVIRMSASEVSTMGRDTQGVKVMKLNEGDKVVALAKIVLEEE
ncbi:MAG: DNA gyrase subunit A [Tissierellales bacterium]|nr:DNA gyrase subunit A [Tissierellales bacterium]MBN2827198.1 DNA gyrase subunit A [Tissierellales bacterium]